MSRLSVLPRIALAQMAVRPGRPDLNVARMLELIDEARDAGAAVVAFPELCVPGYIIGDLWEVDALVEDFVGWSDVVRDASAGLTVVFGKRRDRPGAHWRRWTAAQVPMLPMSATTAPTCAARAYRKVFPDGVHIKDPAPELSIFR